MYSDTPGETFVVKFDVDGVLTDIEETFLNCIDGDLGDYMDIEGYDLAKEVCRITNLAYKNRRDLLVPREDGIPEKLEGIRSALVDRVEEEIEIVISTSREGIDGYELEESLKAMGIENYDEARIEYDKWKDCDILVEDNPYQIRAFLDENPGNEAYHVTNECSKMVYGDRGDIYKTGRCFKVDSFSDIIDGLKTSSLEAQSDKEIPVNA